MAMLELLSKVKVKGRQGIMEIRGRSWEVEGNPARYDVMDENGAIEANVAADFITLVEKPNPEVLAKVIRI